MFGCEVDGCEKGMYTVDIAHKSNPHLNAHTMSVSRSNRIIIIRAAASRLVISFLPPLTPLLISSLLELSLFSPVAVNEAFDTPFRKGLGSDV